MLKCTLNRGGPTGALGALGDYARNSYLGARPMRPNCAPNAPKNDKNSRSFHGILIYENYIYCENYTY